MAKKLTEKMLNDVWNSMDGAESPESFQLGPEATVHLAWTVKIMEMCENELEFIFDNKRYRLTMNQIKQPSEHLASKRASQE